MLNTAGYYTEPTPQNVAVSLLQAQIETANTDPSVYLTENLQTCGPTRIRGRTRCRPTAT